MARCFDSGLMTLVRWCRSGLRRAIKGNRLDAVPTHEEAPQGGVRKFKGDRVGITPDGMPRGNHARSGEPPRMVLGVLISATARTPRTIEERSIHRFAKLDRLDVFSRARVQGQAAR